MTAVETHDTESTITAMAISGTIDLIRRAGAMEPRLGDALLPASRGQCRLRAVSASAAHQIPHERSGQ